MRVHVREEQVEWMGEENGQLITNANYARHVRTCRAQGRAQGREIVEVNVVANEKARRVRVKEGERCGRVLSTSNMARHLRGCRMWDSGGEPSP